MKLQDWALGNHVFNADDRDKIRQLLAEFEGMFERFGVPDTPCRNLRTLDVVIAYVHARQLDALLADAQANAEADAKGPPQLSLFDAAGKAHERMRKAMKELEDYCNKAGTPIDVGLADIMKPIIEKAEGVLEDALEFEAHKQKNKKEQDGSGA